MKTIEQHAIVIFAAVGRDFTRFGEFQKRKTLIAVQACLDDGVEIWRELHCEVKPL